MQRMLKILSILQKYITSDYFLFTEHDVIGFIFDYDLLSQEDIEELNRLNVFYSDEYCSYIMYT